MFEPLTLMIVHAHPDDEAIGSGGVLAKYAADGQRTVLVTCTLGEEEELRGELLANEYFIRIASRVPVADGLETDLFAGVDNGRG